MGKRLYEINSIVETMDFLFENEYDNVASGYDEGNRKSKRVHEKIGLRFYKEEENSWKKWCSYN